VPELPRYDLFVWDDAWRDIGHAELPCNFVQIMENSVDPYHVEWLHGRYGSFLRGESLPVVTKKHVKVAFEVFEHGILKRRVLEGHTEEDDDWKVGHPLVFPHMLRVGAAGLATFQIRVPIDDENTWHVWYQTYRPDGGAPPQPEIPVYEVPLKDERGEWLRDYVDGQDIVAWITQGRISGPVARAPRPFGPRRDPPAQALRAADGTGGARRGPAVHLPHPARRDRPADGARQVRLGRRVPAAVDAGELDPLLPHPFRGPERLSEDAAVTERGLLLDLGGTAFGSGLERLALLGEREPAVRSIAARRGPAGAGAGPAVGGDAARGDHRARVLAGAVRRGRRGAGQAGLADHRVHAPVVRDGHGGPAAGSGGAGGGRSRGRRPGRCADQRPGGVPRRRGHGGRPVHRGPGRSG
jgi:hypothetical protein